LLACKRSVSHQNRMAAPWIMIQFVKAFHHAGPQGIQVNISDQLQQIRFFLTDNGLVPILEEVTGSLVVAIERDGIAG